MWPRNKYLKRNQTSYDRNPNRSGGDDNARSSNRSISPDNPATGKVTNTTNKQVSNDYVPLSRSSGPSPNEFQSHPEAATSRQDSREVKHTESVLTTGIHHVNRSSSDDHRNVSVQEKLIVTWDKPRRSAGEVISTGQILTGKSRALSVAIKSTTIPEQVGQFTGTHGFTMNNPTFNDTLNLIHNNQNTYFTSGQPVLMLLGSAGAPEAALDNGGRCPPPRCHPGTRRTIRENLTRWLQNLPLKERMVWLSGLAGVGKSAIAQSFAEHANEMRRLGSTFFFSRTQGEKRSDPRKVIPTLAYQLAIRDKQYQHVVGQQLASDPSVLEAALNVQFRKLIVKPFLDLAPQYIQSHDVRDSLLVVIDGLDKCNDKAAQCELLELIHEAARRPEIPLIWLVCSRPESHIIHTFSQFGSAPICGLYGLWADDEARADVEGFLHDRFQEIYNRYHYMIQVDGGSWPSRADFETIAKAADGNFSIAVIAERFIGDRVAGNPQARLAILLDVFEDLGSIEGSNPLELLDASYSDILARVPGHAWSLAVQALGLCIYNLDRVCYFDSNTELTSTKRLWLFLQTDQAHFYHAMEMLHSVLDIPPVEDASEKRLTFHNTTFPDYLTSARRSKKFCILEEEAFLYHSDCAFYWYNIILQFQNPSRVSADEHCHAESRLRAWFDNEIHGEFEAFKLDVVSNFRTQYITELWESTSIDDNFHFDLVDDEESNETILPMFLVRDARTNSYFVRTEIKDGVVDPKLLRHLSLLTNGRRIEPLDITAAENPFEMMQKKSIRYVIAGNGSKSGLACIGHVFGTSVWQVIWLNSASPPTKEQKALYRKWDNEIIALSGESDLSSGEDATKDDI